MRGERASHVACQSDSILAWQRPACCCARTAAYPSLLMRNRHEIRLGRPPASAVHRLVCILPYPSLLMRSHGIRGKWAPAFAVHTLLCILTCSCAAHMKSDPISMLLRTDRSVSFPARAGLVPANQDMEAYSMLVCTDCCVSPLMSSMTAHGTPKKEDSPTGKTATGAGKGPQPDLDLKSASKILKAE